MDLRFTSQNLIITIPPPVGQIIIGIPLSGIYANQWCYMDDTGTIYLIGGGVFNVNVRAATFTLVASGTYTVTFGTAYPGGTNIVVTARCYNALGNVGYNITNITALGFKIKVAIACSVDFIATIVNDIPIVI